LRPCWISTSSTTPPARRWRWTRSSGVSWPSSPLPLPPPRWPGGVGLTRQKVNYHLRALEEHKLVEPAEERRWGGLTERLMVATATSYVVSPAALGAIGADPARNGDRHSASYMIAVAARIVREVGSLWARARLADKRLATLSIDTVVRFRSPADRAAFTSDLASAIAALAARYHDETAMGGRSHRLVVASYPAPEPTQP
jgi:DNA-binding transcriptional ArsR family regulator